MAEFVPVEPFDIVIFGVTVIYHGKNFCPPYSTDIATARLTISAALSAWRAVPCRPMRFSIWCATVAVPQPTVSRKINGGNLPPCLLISILMPRMSRPIGMA